MDSDRVATSKLSDRANSWWSPTDPSANSCSPRLGVGKFCSCQIRRPCRIAWWIRRCEWLARQRTFPLLGQTAPGPPFMNSSQWRDIANHGNSCSEGAVSGLPRFHRLATGQLSQLNPDLLTSPPLRLNQSDDERPRSLRLLPARDPARDTQSTADTHRCKRYCNASGRVFRLSRLGDFPFHRAV